MKTTSPQQVIEPLLTVGDVSSVFAIHPRTVRNWAAEGILSPVRVGRTVRFRREDVQALIDSRDASMAAHPRNGSAAVL